MAGIQSKRSSRRPQPARKTRKRRRFPSLPKPIITRRGKTTIRRYNGRRFHRFEEAQGKPLDYIELFTTGEYHSIAVRFQDKTCMNFVIEPTFTLEPEYSDWKTGNGRRIKRWPLIRSQPHNA
ncbi:MAG: hypothetical protein LAO76_19215 [Acidobacteriia bacterium]|nr:hypothetical protein [Terriglobia bacterium]